MAARDSSLTRCSSSGPAAPKGLSSSSMGRRPSASSAARRRRARRLLHAISAPVCSSRTTRRREPGRAAFDARGIVRGLGGPARAAMRRGDDHVRAERAAVRASASASASLAGPSSMPGQHVAVQVDQRVAPPQYAPRPESTAGIVARRISMSRASDQPATYW